MSKIPDQIIDSPTVAAIYAAWEKHADEPRTYLGASSIGKPCDRALWYEFRWCGGEKFSGRMLRLFNTGHLEEKRIADDLREIGCEVHTTDRAGQQFAVVALGGHFRGHMDGVCLGLPEAPKTWHLCEFKTHNVKSFSELRRKGVKDAKPEHFCQMQIYMHLAGLTRAIYLAVCKDTDELYAQRVEYDKAAAEQILARAKSIIESDTPPEKIGGPDHWECRFCPHRNRCHGQQVDHAEPAVPCRITCRNCIHSTPIVDESTAGQWRCERHGKPLARAEQENGCDDHRLIPDLITFAAPIDSHQKDNWIEYADRETGTTFHNIAGKGWGYTSKELATIPLSQMRGLAGDVKKQLGATVIAKEDAPF